MNENKNPCSFDSVYKTSIFMGFKQSISELTYQKFYFSRNIHQLTFHIIFKFLQIISLYFLQECYFYDPFFEKCPHKFVMIFSMLSIIAFFILLSKFQLKIHNICTQLILSFISSYIYIGYLEYLNNIQFLIIFLCIDLYVSSSFSLFNWKYYLMVLLVHYVILYLYLTINDIALKEEFYDNFIFLMQLLALSLIIFSLNEIFLRKNWIIIDSFKRSETFLINMIENLASPTFLTNPSLNIIFVNKEGLTILQNEIPEKENSLQTFFDNILSKEEIQVLNSMINVVVQEKKILNKKFFLKKNMNKSKARTKIGDVFSISISQVLFIINILNNSKKK